VTTEDFTPYRSVLYMPGANEKVLLKAASLPCDAFILDLEDAVAPDQKVAARTLVATATTDGRYGERPVVIRVNGTDTSWFADDVMAAVAAKPDAILVPKLGSLPQLAAIEAALEKAQASDDIALWGMLETPEAVLNAASLVGASERLTTVVMGTNDLVKELRATHQPGRAPVFAALSWCVLAARASNTRILDGVYNDVSNVDGFTAEARQAREMGFDGKTLIHPSQIEPCNTAFSPQPDEIADAKEIIAAFEAATARGEGVVTVNGRLVENLHVEDAKRILALAERLA
jgi:citrate lyase subunit beta/citryl-CoA lyase